MRLPLTKIKQQRTKIQLYLEVVLILVFFNSCHKESEDAQFRIGNFLVAETSISVHIYEGDKEIAAFCPSYGKLTEYMELSPKIYRVVVKSDDRPLLDKKLGLGSDGLYTFVLAGIPEEQSRVNEQSTSASLQRIVGGAAVETTNAFLPQLLVLNDYFSSSDDSPRLRCITLTPGMVGLDANFSIEKDTTTFHSMPYPNLSKTQTINPGKGTVSVTLSGASQKPYSMDFDFKENRLYTLFIFPDPNHYLTKLEAVVVGNPRP